MNTLSSARTAHGHRPRGDRRGAFRAAGSLLLVALISLSPAAPATADTATAAGATTTADSEAGLGPSPETWENSVAIGSAAVVQIQTVASADVRFAQDGLVPHKFSDIRDPRTEATGTYINRRRNVLTGKGAIHLEAAQRQRFGNYAVNSAFVEAGYLKPLSDDARFLQQAITKDTAAGYTLTSWPEADGQLQDCYQLERAHHCAVALTLEIRVFPNLHGDQGQRIPGILAQPALERGLRTAVLNLGTDPGRTPLTLHLAVPDPGALFHVVASHGPNEEVGTHVQGHITQDASLPVVQKDLDRIATKEGTAGVGAPMVSEQGDLVALADRGPDQKMVAVPVAVIAKDLETVGVQVQQSPNDQNFQDGLRMFEAKDFRNAQNKFQQVADDTKQQNIVVDLLDQARDKAKLPSGVSADTTSLVSDSGNSAPDSWPVRLTVAVLLMLAAIAGLIWVLRRGRRERRVPSEIDLAGLERSTARGALRELAPTEPRRVAGPAGPTTRLPEPGPEPGRFGSATVRSGSTSAGSFCRRCGAQLSDEDRFCFSCGVPTKKT